MVGAVLAITSMVQFVSRKHFFMSDKPLTALEKIFANKHIHDVIIRPNVLRPGEYAAFCRMADTEKTIYGSNGYSAQEAVDNLLEILVEKGVTFHG